ncbi:hypothetical protein [Salinigranum sp. GCM10025319]|uniref:hypothetical protein n=1 Tax=Salinigranum sp. GCM10025319 TaxID=3252687 RepID=UPI003609B4DB
MQRRKYLAALGSLAAGGAAIGGTGAFSSVRAERDIDVAVAGDSTAYLGLDASISPYAQQVGNQLVLKFDGSTSGQDGDGLNVRADTTFSNVFKIQNNGTNTIRVQLGNDDGSPAIGSLPDGPMAVFYSDSELSSPSVGNYTPFAASPAPSYYPSADVTNQDLGPGDDFYVHFGFFLNGDIQSLGSGASTSLADAPDDLGIYTDATPDTDGL